MVSDFIEILGCGGLIAFVMIGGPLLLCGKENRKAWFKEVREGWGK